MNEKNRRTDMLAAGLAGRILSGVWPEGHKLPGDDLLCAEFDVSRTVVREAFRLLTGKGLLTARPRIGTIVAAQSQWSLLDADMLDWLAQCGALSAFAGDIDDVRLALEPSFAALAAARADAAANHAIQDALRALQADPDRAHELAFLKTLYSAAGNRLAVGFAGLAKAALALRQTPPPLLAYADMTAAIAQKDGARARQAALQALLAT